MFDGRIPCLSPSHGRENGLRDGQAKRTIDVRSARGRKSQSFSLIAYDAVSIDTVVPAVFDCRVIDGDDCFSRFIGLITPASWKKTLRFETGIFLCLRVH